MNYVIIKLSESKTTKGAVTYYVITEERGGGVSKRLMDDYGGGGGGWSCVDISKLVFVENEIVFKPSTFVLLKLIICFLYFRRFINLY